MRKILSYAKSHIYDIHAIMVAVLLVVLLSLVRKFGEKRIQRLIDEQIAQNPMKTKKGLLRKWNMFFLVLLMIIGVMGFALLAVFSPFIDFSMQSSIMVGIYALCGEALVEQVVQRDRDINNK